MLASGEPLETNACVPTALLEQAGQTLEWLAKQPGIPVADARDERSKPMISSFRGNVTPVLASGRLIASEWQMAMRKLGTTRCSRCEDGRRSQPEY